MTEVHIRTYQERRATLTTYDWQRRHYVQREHVRFVPTTQVVEFDDSEPVGPHPTNTRRAESMRRARDVLQRNGPMTRKRLADLVGVASSTIDNIVGMASDIHVIVKDRHATIIGLPGQTYKPPQRYTPTALRMAEYLRQHGVSTAVEIANGTGTNARHAPRVLQRYRDDLFRVVDVSRTQYGRPKFHWDVIRSD